MAIIYEATSDETVVEKVETQEIELQQLIDQFLSLKQEYLNLPDYNKTVPDQETLDFWNQEMNLVLADQVMQIKQGAIVLKGHVDPIRDAGLLPAQFEDEYQQLVDFINNTP